MAIEVTERWTEESLTRAADGWRAVRAFGVIGTDDQDAALTATGIPDVNDAHEKSAYLKMRTKTSRHQGYNAWIITCNYSIPTSGDRHTGVGAGLDGDADPFLAPLRLSWANITENLPAEIDRNNNPIVNSANMPFDTMASKTWITKELTVIRNEPYYDLSKAETYENTVNSREWELRGYGNIGVRKAKCKSILPSTEYTQDASFVEIAYKFWLRADTHRLRRLDHGYYEDLTDTGQQPIRLDDGREVTVPQLLDGEGALIGTTHSGNNAVTWMAETHIEDHCVWLEYDLYDEVDFRELQL